MRTKVISRWRKAVVAAAAAASLAAPGARAQDKGQPVEDGPARSPAAAEPPGDVPAPPIEDGPAPLQGGSEVRGQLTTPQQPQGEAQIYVIQKGDTLWDLSQKFLSNPWYWPRIWSLNPSIENPHWIYPGNKLKVTPGQGGAPAQVEVTAQAGQPEAPPALAEEEPLPATPPSGPADLGVSGKDAAETAASYRAVTASGRLSFTPPKAMNTRVSGLISPEELDQAGVIDGSFEEKQLLASYDTAYVRFRHEPGMKAGDQLVIFRPEGNIIDPTNHRKLAQKVRTLGVAHVVGVNEDSLTVQIGSTWEEIARGDLVRPWVEQKKRITPKPNRTAVEGVIIASTTSDLVTLGEAHEVYINRGSKDGVEEGNTFTVVQRGDGLGTIGGGFTSYTGGAGQMRNAPEETVGLLIVLDVKDHVSTAVVVKSIRELEPGQRVAMRTGGAPGSGGE
jgi:nucleoid-associated protein YgaU